MVGRFWDWPFIPGVALRADGGEDFSSSLLSRPGTARAWVLPSSPFSANPSFSEWMCVSLIQMPCDCRIQ